MPVTAPSLAQHVQLFFGDYLTTQRDLSPHTIASYRDTFKLFLAFASRRLHVRVVDLGFDDVGPATVLAFLEDLEKARQNSVRTRNVRLAALHSFFRFVAGREPRLLEVCQRVGAIPVKKTGVRPAVYLEHDEVLHVLAIIDQSTPLGRRDHLLIRLLFETGVRAQEIAGIRTSHLRLSGQCQVRVIGKGRKERICPLRSKTAALIRELLRDRGATPQDMALFVGARGEGLTRHGVLRLVQRHVRRAAKTMPSLAAKRVGAHTFRHAAAIHLLRSGNDLSVVRSWLGHVSVVTTDHYTEIDTETKRRALEASEPIPTPRLKPTWKRDPDLLAWLEALGLCDQWKRFLRTATGGAPAHVT